MRISNPTRTHDQLTGVSVGQHHAAPGAFLDDASISRFMLPGWSQYSYTNNNGTAERLYFMPILLERATTFDRIGVKVTTLAGGSVVRLGIYAALFNGDGELTPGALTLDAGTIDSSSTGDKLIVIDVTLGEGYHFLAHSSAHIVGMQGLNPAGGLATPVTPITTSVGGVTAPALAATIADGAAALPDPAPTPTITQNTTFLPVRLRQ